MAAGNARYFRYILFAFFGLTVIYFVTSSSSQRLPTRDEVLRGGKQWVDKPAALDKEDIYQAAADEGTTSGVKTSPSSKNYPDEKKPARIKSGTKTNSDIDDDLMGSPGRVSYNPKTELSPPLASGARMNATFVTLARNSDLWEIARSIRQVEDRFNRKYGYDWVFLNDKPFDDEFKKVTTALVSGKTHYGLIDEKHWSFPDHIDQDKAKKVREDMAQKKVIYGDSISYRHMCRFESGFFFQQPLMMNYEWYWRVEPSIELFCDINYDPFKYMADHKKKYSFVLSLYEYVETIETLWDSTLKFMKNHPEHIAEDNSMAFLSDDGGKTYNHCHMWSNFEIGNLNWLRGKAYTDFFESLDQDGGFFYERWGDAPVHSIAAGILLKKDEIHFFNDIAYFHVPFTHCPTGEKTRLDLKCHCDPKNNFDWKGYSCTSRYFEINKLAKPEGWEAEKD